MAHLRCRGGLPSPTELTLTATPPVSSMPAVLEAPAGGAGGWGGGGGRPGGRGGAAEELRAALPPPPEVPQAAPVGNRRGEGGGPAALGDSDAGRHAGEVAADLRLVERCRLIEDHRRGRALLIDSVADIRRPVENQPVIGRMGTEPRRHCGRVLRPAGADRSAHKSGDRRRSNSGPAPPVHYIPKSRGVRDSEK